MQFIADLGCKANRTFHSAACRAVVVVCYEESMSIEDAIHAEPSVIRVLRGELHRGSVVREVVNYIAYVACS